MALPKLETPKHSCVLPITKQTVFFRPFLVGEQKVLLQAQESEDQQLVARETIRLLEHCVDDVKVNKLPTGDVEYLFLQLRIKSIGETSDVVLICQDKECSADVSTTIDLESAQLIEPEEEVSPIVELTPEISMEFILPNFELVNKMTKPDDEKMTAQQMFQIISGCVVSIIHGEEVHSREDFSDKELTEFMDSMSSHMLSNIQEFFAAVPKMVIDTKYKCKVCERDNDMRLEGIQNFFA
tara:strand:- start:336 stop:1055 length:720 start_codon:yes stop_codon:yes gene_type:complete